jgi:tRNA G18 (ribose-2'-O)-methylase SpoU
LIQEITGEDDPRLERYRHVGDARWLRDQQLFVAEGRLVVERLITGRGYEIDSVLVTPAAFRALEPVLQRASLVYVADQRVVNGITGFNFHRGCLAIAHRPPQGPSLDTFARARLVIVLEGIDNPDNVGGIFRSAAALGADGVILDPRSSDPLYRKALRTSMGAVLRLPFARVDSDAWLDSFDVLRRMGFTIAALTPAGALSIDDFVSRHAAARVAFVAGSEGAGLTAEVLARSDVSVRIPIDARSDSLNVVVAVSIALQRLAQY